MSISLNGDGIISGVTTFTTAVTGVTTFSSVVIDSGSTSAPAISPNGDSNTGVFFPLPDTFAVSTNGTQRLLIEDDGDINIDSGGVFYDATNNRLAIGTTSPSAILQINKGSTAAGIATGTRYTIPYAAGADNGQSIDLGLETNSGAKFASIQMACPNFAAHNGSYITFRTSNETTGSPSTDLSLERARIDSSGRLLVGTSSALAVGGSQHILQTESTISADTIHGASFVRHGGTTAAAGAAVSIARTRGTSTGAVTAVANGDTLGYIIFSGANGTDLSNNAAWIRCEVDGEPFTSGDTTDLPGRLVFSTTADGESSPTERMRIDSAGAIYSTTAGGGFRVAESDDAVWRRALSQGGLTNWTNHIFFRQSGVTTNRGIKFSTYDGIGTEAVMLELFNGGGALFPNIGTTASAANAFLDSGASNSLLRSTSSLRYKTNIEDLEESRANAIFNLRPVWYRSLADADRSDWSWYGLIAEEVAEIEPRLVHWTYLEDAFNIKYQTIENEDGTTSQVETERTLKPGARQVPDGVQYDRLTVLLLDVVKRQQQAIETLEAKVAALESQ